VTIHDGDNQSKATAPFAKKDEVFLRSRIFLMIFGIVLFPLSFASAGPTAQRVESMLSEPESEPDFAEAKDIPQGEYEEFQLYRKLNAELFDAAESLGWRPVE